MRVAIRKLATTAPKDRHEQSDVFDFLHATHEHGKPIPSWQDHEVTPWCSAFVNSCMQKTGRKDLAGTGSAAAASWIHWGTKCSAPEWGCVAVVKRGSDKNGNPLYHAGFFIETSPDGLVYLLAGNQHPKKGSHVLSVNIRAW